MEPSEALRIIQSLADGVDPHTGEVFPEDSPYQHPQVLRALFVAVTALERLQESQRRAKRLPDNAGKPWNDADDKALSDDFDAGLTTAQLAQKHQRTEGAIRARLEKLGKVPPGVQSGRSV
jgi:hypothetical protein